MNQLAFPNDVSLQAYGRGGMTQRDYFAAKAMQGWLASFPEDADAEIVRAATIARLAYKIADAMLEARNAA